MPRVRRSVVAFCTTHIKAEDHGFAKIADVRYLATTEGGVLNEPYTPLAWQQPGLDWHQDDNGGDLHLGPRPYEQAVVEIEGD